MVAASPARQCAVARDPGVVGPLVAFQEAMTGALREWLDLRPVLPGAPELLDYLRASTAFAAVESVRLIFLTSTYRLIGDEVMWTGTATGSALHVREVFVRALELQASCLVIAHNHPGGDPWPSEADVRVTRSIAEIGRQLEIRLLDHVIVGRNGHVSLAEAGLLA